MTTATRPRLSGWTPVPGWPGYQAHPDGLVRGPQRVLRGTPQRGGLRRICLREGRTGSLNSRARWCFIHTVILETFVGPCPPGQEACHRNGDPSDNRLANLRWDTHAENMRDAVRHGTHNFVTDNPNYGGRRWP